MSIIFVWAAGSAERIFYLFFYFFCFSMYPVFLLPVCKWDLSSARVVVFFPSPSSSLSLFFQPLFSAHQNQKMKDDSASPPLPLDLFPSPLSVLGLRRCIDWLVVSAVNNREEQRVYQGSGVVWLQASTDCTAGAHHRFFNWYQLAPIMCSFLFCFFLFCECAIWQSSLS